MMKRIRYLNGKELYDCICDMDNIRDALDDACRNHSHDPAVQRIKENPEPYVRAVKDILDNESFHYTGFKQRTIFERGKLRELCYTRTFPDRVIEHCVFNIIAPILHASVPTCEWAAIKGKGAHHCSAKLHNDLIHDWKGTRYCLKVDMHHFFDSIVRIILFNMIKKKIKCPRTLKILHTLIFDTPDDRGLKIGLYGSQILSVFYLSGLDHYLKEVLGLRYVYRYMDDIVVLSSSKIVLRSVLIHMRKYLKEELDLELKDNYAIFPVEKRRIDFVGYVLNHLTVMIRKKTKMKYIGQCHMMIRHVRRGIPITTHDTLSKRSYEGMFAWCTDRTPIEKYDGMVDTMITFGVC